MILMHRSFVSPHFPFSFPVHLICLYLLPHPFLVHFSTIDVSLLLFPSTLLGMLLPTPLASTLPWIAAAFYISIPSPDTFMSSCSICPLSSVALSSSQSLGLATCKIILDISPHLICLQSYWMYFPVSLQSLLPIFMSVVTALIQAFLISKSFLPEILPLYFLSISPSLCLSFTLTVCLAFACARAHTHTRTHPFPQNNQSLQQIWSCPSQLHV